MDSDSQIFAREIVRLKFRGVFVPEHSRSKPGYDVVRKNAEALISSARAVLPKLPPIYFDFVDDGRVNALAFEADGRYFIGLTFGTVYILELLFMRMLSDSRLFEIVGDAAQESSDVPLLTKYVPEAYSLYYSGQVAQPPKTRPRHAYATELLFDAIRFLIGHEIAHISLGHVDYIRSTHGKSCVAEANWQDSAAKPQATIERQCMEARADMRSVAAAIQSLKLRHEYFKTDLPPWTDSAPSARLLIFTWAIAMNTVFRLFGDIRFNPSQLDLELYPPLPIRRLMAASAACCEVKSSWGDRMLVNADLALRAAISYVEHAFAVVYRHKHFYGWPSGSCE